MCEGQMGRPISGIEERSSSLYRDREKLRSLTEELRCQKVEVKALQLMHTADKKTIAIRDARIQELVNANESSVSQPLLREKPMKT